MVHAHSPVAAASARLLVRSIPRSRRPVFVSTEHNRWPSHARPTRAANAATYVLNDAAIAVSAEVRRSMAAPFRASTQVIVHGIDLDQVRGHRRQRDQVRAELGVGPDQVLAVTVANFRAPKGYPDLLAAARLVARGPTPVRFVIIGQGPQEADLRRLHAQLGLTGTVDIVGYRADAARVTAAADLFVLASHHEGLPVSVMEALALGVPVVATDVGGLSEAVVDDDSGRLVPARRPDLLAAAVAELAGERRPAGPPGRRGRPGPPGRSRPVDPRRRSRPSTAGLSTRPPAAGSGPPAGGDAHRGDPGRDVGDDHRARRPPPHRRRSTHPG